MKKLLLVFAVVLTFAAVAVIAQESQPAAPAAPELNVENAVICTGIDKMQPVGAASTFPKTVGKVYAYMKVVNAKPPTEVKVTWFYQDKELDTVTLQVKSASWRTWANKTIVDTMTGAWKAEIKDASGNLVTTLNFTIE